ncbi:MAG: IS1634 family transposase [Clostridia bacterium]|nr:IS1634 family transposase [Clostridia bacterium]
MRLSITHTKNNTYFYMIKSYRNDKGKNTSKIIECLGNIEEVKKKANGEDPIEWAKKYIEQKTIEENENRGTYFEKLVEGEELDTKQKLFNLGHIFIKKIFKELKLDELCKEIKSKYKVEFELSDILEDLICTRIMYPASKYSSYEEAQKFIRQPKYKLYDVYRALDIIVKEKENIEKWCYEKSQNVIKTRNTSILYYDCTNYFFEIELEDVEDLENNKTGLRKYGKSKENRPLPIAQMGLFIDGSGYPLAFNLNSGNTNEQTTLRPLEKQIMKDFQLSKFLVCTDAGLGSFSNREFNTRGEKTYIVTQSLKQLKNEYLVDALSNTGWHIVGNNKSINLKNIEKYDSSNKNIYYKEILLERTKKDAETKEKITLKERMIITFSPRYAAYQKNIRDAQIVRAKEIIEKHPEQYSKLPQNNAKRFIQKENITSDGECAEKYKLYYKNELEKYEEQFDGLYGLCVPENMDATVEEILQVSKGRWEIEESFRIMKTEFKARPVYLHKEDRIRAHFIICYLSLLVYRILEKSKLQEKYTTEEIITTLKEMVTNRIDGIGYKQLYKKTDITSSLNDCYEFDLDKKFISEKNMKKILKS